jgi:hypothetical protein
VILGILGILRLRTSLGPGLLTSHDDGTAADTGTMDVEDFQQERRSAKRRWERVVAFPALVA